MGHWCRGRHLENIQKTLFFCGLPCLFSVVACGSFSSLTSQLIENENLRNCDIKIQSIVVIEITAHH